MAKLQYPSMIECSEKYTALAELGNQLDLSAKRQIMTSLVELLDDKWIELLAEKWSVTDYDGLFVADNHQSKRQLIRNAVKLHRYKGTPWAIRDVLRQLGFGEIELDEGLKARNYKSHQGVAAIPEDERWACYAIRFNQPITNEQSSEIRKVLLNFAPARCVLAVLDYKATPIRYNNKATYNGAYNHGSA